MPEVGLTWSAQKEGRMDSRSDRLDPAAADWYGNKRKPFEKNFLRPIEDSTPSVYNMVKAAPLLIDRSVQRKDKAKRGLGIGSDVLFYRMTAEETGCSELDAKKGFRGDEA
eukprot:7773714-Alexandrium_andersonii.AAC.1